MKTGGFFMGKIMKKVFFLLFTVLPVVATARTMCVRDNSLVISLDKNINGTTSGYSKTEPVWWVDFPYGRIYGEATVLSAAEGLGRTNTQGSYYGIDEYANTPIVAEAGLSGVDANGNERKYCWCRITHPVQSLWVFEQPTSACTSYCAGIVQNYDSMRHGLFKSIGIQ